MGNSAAKPARQAPARYVAKQLPRAPKDIEEEFAKAKLTIQGINSMKEKASTTPQPYVEVKATGENRTSPTDASAPRWYMNTWMEMMDNRREDRAIISGQMPTSWFRDHHEPYSLVRNRIDDEDLDWLLSEGKKMPIEELLQHTKLERESLEDILATVEAPRKQYRNYQGKIHKAIDETNTFMADRKQRMEENRNEELLRQIGYSDEELEDEKQYMTNRSRGVKTLDDLGVSIRRKKRSERFAQQNDMEILLEERRLAAIEAGEYVPSKEEIAKPEHVGRPKGSYYKTREIAMGSTMRMDMSNDVRDRKARKGIVDWLEKRKDIEYGKDNFTFDDQPGAMPVYHEGLSQTEEEAKKDMAAQTARNMMMVKAQGAKKWADPASQYDTMLGIMNYDREMRTAEARGEATPDGSRPPGSAFAEAAVRLVDESTTATEAQERAGRPRTTDPAARDAMLKEKQGGGGVGGRLGYTPRIERQLMQEQTQPTMEELQSSVSDAPPADPPLPDKKKK